MVFDDRQRLVIIRRPENGLPAHLFLLLLTILAII